MSNFKKYCFFTITYWIGFMFCTGAIVQTFLLHVGFSESQVYIYSSLTSMVQVFIMLPLTFLADRIRNVKVVCAISNLSLGVMAIPLLVLAIYPEVMSIGFVALFFVITVITYTGVGLNSILQYRLPYHVIDMADYGRVSAMSCALAGGITFLFSNIYTYLVNKLDYMHSMLLFIPFAVLCFIVTTMTILSMKTMKEQDDTTQGLTKESVLAVFKNRDTYLLILPNLTRGLAGGVLGLITVIGIGNGLVDEHSSGWINTLAQAGLFLGNIAYAAFCKKYSSGGMLLLSSVGFCLALPFCLKAGSIGFFVFFAVAYFFKMMNDTAVPVAVAEIIPEEQMGAFTSIRMLVMTAAQAISALIMIPISNLVGDTGLLIFAGIMQLLCGVPYYLIYVARKRQKRALAEQALENA